MAQKTSNIFNDRLYISHFYLRGGNKDYKEDELLNANVEVVITEPWI